MSPTRLLPACLLLLAGCSEPPMSRTASEITVPVGCEDACAAGYRWAVENKIDNPVKCRGENAFADGCRSAVAFVKPF